MVRASPIGVRDFLFGIKNGRIGFSGNAAIWQTAQPLLQSGSDLLRKLLKRCGRRSDENCAGCEK